MPRTEVPITGSVLRWAIEQSGWIEEELAERLNVEVEHLRAWEQGEEHPSKTEFNRLVAALKRPSALFFMSSPPEVETITARFRSTPGVIDHRLTEEESRALRRAEGLRDLLAWVLQERGEQPVDLPRYDAAGDPETAGTDLRRTWGPSFSEQLRWATASDAFKGYRELLEARGLFVFQMEIRRSGLRGFSLWDEHAPLVVVKSGFNFPARVYTLFHEVGHLVSRSESACHGFADPDDESDPRIERWCESFAAAYLLPRDEVTRTLAERWGITRGQQVTEFDLVMAMASTLNVSGRALAIRLRNLGYADHGLYEEVNDRARVVDMPDPDQFARSGRRPQRRLREFGSRATSLMADAAAEGLIGRKDTLDHLGVSLSEFQQIERRLLED